MAEKNHINKTCKHFKSIKAHKGSNISIRLKVTEKCSWDCIFCHKEGGWDIDDVQWNPLTSSAITSLIDSLGISEIHYTGGEPTCHKNLGKLTKGLTSLGLTVKTTTNGQFDATKLKEMRNSGLNCFNFSMLSLNPADLARVQKNMSIRRAAKSIQCQKKIILKAKKLGVDLKINTVVSTINDIKRAIGVFEFAKENGILVRFLKDLGNDAVAVTAIDTMIMENLNAKKIWRKATSGSSSFTTYYKDNNGFNFGVKGIRKNRLKSMCAGCREKCSEQFYGIRLEQKKEQFFVRLCIHRNDEKSYMPLEDFLKSDQLMEIRKNNIRPAKAA